MVFYFISGIIYIFYYILLNFMSDMNKIIHLLNILMINGLTYYLNY